MELFLHSLILKIWYWTFSIFNSIKFSIQYFQDLIVLSSIVEIFSSIEHFRYSLFDTDYQTFSNITENFQYFYWTFSVFFLNILTLKEAGGVQKGPYGFSIGCHFSQDHAMITKILGFINKHPKLKVVKSFSYHLYRFFRNLAETGEKLQFFWSENREINFFFNFFIIKVSYIVSKPNDDFHEASFKVYYVSVS